MKIILAAVVAIWMGLGALAVRPAQADDVKVFSAGAVRAIVTDLAEQFRQETGTTVTFSFGTAGQTRQKLLSGEPVDVVILTDAGIDDMIRQGALASGSRADLARTGMGVGVREGAPKPDITTSEAFKTTLLKAKSLVYVDPAQGATSGVHFKSVLERLGIADAVRSKTQLVSGGYPAEKVASGEAELVVHQISEIVPVKGVTLVGPLPPDFQKVTVYSAGLAARSPSPGAARAFVAFLTRPAFKPKLAAAGLDYR
ncbi:MAG TPA: substrate-binding domain-containing protein [Methylomirabilota bacterium]|jgi:molybdate transport system substrate-binding protein|nr:substrate-binding domain-containing protein [Methylomirabilota bacterium]